MALEGSFDTINDLVITNPAEGDSRTEGDDHLRGIKKAVKGSFPNIGASAANPTAAEFNVLASVTAGTAAANKALVLDGSKAISTITTATVTNLTSTTVDINGGAIDGTTIGASSASAGTFAALTGTVVTCSTSLGLASGTTVNDIDTAMAGSPTDNQLLTAQGIQEYVIASGGQTQSADLSINPLAAGANNVAHTLSATPEVVDWYLECIDGTQTGFALGDRLFHITGGGSSNGFAVQAAATNIRVNWDAPVYATDDSGTTQTLTPAYWKFVGRASTWDN